MSRLKAIILLSFFTLISCGKEDEIENLQPVIVDQFFEIKEHSAKGAQVGVVIAEDLNSEQVLSYSIVSGNEKNVFRMNKYSGEITVNDPFNLNRESDPTFELEVFVIDNHKFPDSTSALIIIDVLDVSPLQVGLVGHFPFDGNYGDVSSLSNHAKGDIRLFVEDRFGNDTRAAELKSSFDSTFIVIPHNNIYNFEFEDDFTLSFWIKLDAEQLSGEEESVIITKGSVFEGAGKIPFRLELNNQDRSYWDQNSIKFWNYNGSFCGARSYQTFFQPKTNNLIPERWYYITSVKKKDKLSIYMNGVLEEEKSVWISEECFTNNIYPIIIGNDSRGNSFDGFIDDLMIFNRALESEEVIDIYKY